MYITTKFDKQIKIAANHYYEGNYSVAIKSFEKMLIRYPNESDVYFYLGATLRRILGKEKSAIPILAKAISLNPKKYEYYLQMAPALNLQEEYEDAIGLVDFMIKRFPELSDGYSLKSQILMNQGETKLEDIIDLQNKARKYPGFVLDDETNRYDSTGISNPEDHNLHLEGDLPLITKVNEALIDISAYIEITNSNLNEDNEEDQQLRILLQKIMAKYKSSDQAGTKMNSSATVDLFTYYEED